VCLLLQASFVPPVVGVSAVLGVLLLASLAGTVVGISTAQYRTPATARIKKITGKEKWR
jgi:hypothetical protein